MKATAIGIQFAKDNAQICVWAPSAETVNCHVVDLGHNLPLKAGPYGYWYGETDQIKAGNRYHFVLDGKRFPDPASRAQPDGVHGDSAVVDLTYGWTDQDYQMPARKEWIIYELHVGTFSPTGDFAGIIERIGYLKELGINAIELMPVGQFPGEHNWGYDGVYPYAVQESYGGARGLQQLVDACHQQQNSVILDVVYNHMGPEGNYLPAYGPYFTDKYRTPWGSALNFDDAWSHGTRNFVLQNVCMWFKDFHIDALRLDAVHAIKDCSPVHLLQGIRKITDQIQKETGRTHQLIAECDLNDRRFLDPLACGGFAMDGQWLDEFHHALRVAVGEASKGYYSDFDGLHSLAKAYQHAYVFNGNYSEHRQQFFGSSADGLAGDRFVVFSQNHDHIGNRMLGERSSALYSADKLRLMALALFISPYIPLLFMGEEWAADTPFLYFVDHSDEALIQAVRDGRKKEFVDFQQEGEVPDPQAQDTFKRSCLNWGEKDSGSHKQMLTYYKALIALRKNNHVLKNNLREEFKVTTLQEKGSLLIQLSHGDQELWCFLNFSDKQQDFGNMSSGAWEKIWDTQDLKWCMTGQPALNDQKTITIGPYAGAIFAHKIV